MDKERRLRHIAWKDPLLAVAVLGAEKFGIQITREVVLKSGRTMTVRFPDRVAVEIAIRQDFEPNVTWMLGKYAQIMRRVLDHDIVVWDVGAHQGVKSMYLSDMVGQNGQVVAFEPSRLTLPVLMNNGKRHGFGVIPWALGDENRYARLQDFGYKDASLNTICTPRAKTRLKDCYEVPVVSGDYLVKSGLVPLPNLIKLDIESYEAAAMLGLEEVLTTAWELPVIFEGGDVAYLGSTAECIARLRKYGYTRFWQCDRPGVMRRVTERGTFLEPTNLAATKRVWW